MATSKKSFTQQQIAKQVAKDQKKNNTQSTASSGQKAASAKSGSSSVSAKTYTGLTQERYNQLRNKGYTKEQINQAYNSTPQMTQDLYNRLRRQGYTQKQIEKGQYDREMFIPWHTQDTADKSFNSWGKDIEDFTSWSNKSAGDISKWDTSKAKTYSDLFQKNAYSARNYMLQLDRLGASKDTEEYKAYQDYYNYFTRAARQISSNNDSYLDYRKNNMYDAGGGVYYSYDQAKQIEQQLRDEADRMKNTPKNVTITPVGGFIDTQSQINEKRIPDMLKRADAIRDWLGTQDKHKDEADWYVTNLGRGQDSAQVYQNAAARMADVESQMNDLLSRRPDYYSYGQSDELGNVYAYDDAAYNQAKTAWDAEYDKFRQEVYLPAKRDYDYAQGYQFNSTIQRANTGDRTIQESIERGKAKDAERQAAIKQAQDEALAVAGQLGAASQSGMASATMYYRAGAKERRAADPSTWSEEKLNAYYVLLDEGRTEEADRLAMLTNDAVQKARDYEQILKPLDEFQRGVRDENDNLVLDENGNPVNAGHPRWGTLASFAAGTITPLVFGLPEYFANLTEYAVTGEISNANVTPTQISNRMVSNTADQLNKRYGTIDDSTPVVGGKGVGDLYQVAISVAQSALSLATGRFVAGGMGLSVGSEAYKNAVQAVTLTQFFGSAASSGIYDALEDGLDPGQAILLGTFNGMAEVAGEVLSVENLINIGDAKTMRNLLRDVFTQAGIEASEEAFTTLLNTMADTIVKGDKNDLQTAINSYISQGMDPTTAEKQAIKDWLNGMGQDALSGFLSGGFSSVIQTGRANIGTYKQNVTYLNDLASQTAEGSRSREMAEKYGSRERLSKFRGNQYAEQVKQDLISNNTDTAVRAIEQQLTEKGETGDVHAKAQAIAQAVIADMSGEEAGGWGLTPSAQIAATATKNMREVMDDISKARQEYIDYGRPNSEWTDPIVKGRFLDERVLSRDLGATIKYAQGRNAQKNLEQHTTQIADLEKTIPEMQQEIQEYRKEIGRLNSKDANTPARRAELQNKIAETRQKITEAENAIKGHQAAILQDGYNSYTEKEKAASVKIDGKEYNVSGLTMANGNAQVKLSDADGNTMNVSMDDERLPAPIRSLAIKANSLGWAAEEAFRHYKPGTNVSDFIRQVQSAKAFASEKMNREAFMNLDVVKDMDNIPMAEFLYSHGQDLYNKRQAAVEKARTIKNKIVQAAMEKTGDIDNVRTKGKGRVDTTSGWTFSDGKHYEGIQGKKLTKTQNSIVRMINNLADVLNIDYVIFDGDAKGVLGVSQEGGVIAININAGMNVKRALAAETLSHELTHFQENFAPEEYEALRDAVVNAAYEKNAELFEKRVQAQMRLLPESIKGDQERYDAAVREVVADACTTMLQNSKVVTELARENMTLAEKVHDFIEQTINNIKQAIAEAYADSDPAYRRQEVSLIEDRLNEIQELWDEGLKAAVFNYNALQTMRDATEIGSFSIQQFKEAKDSNGDDVFQVAAFEHDEPEYRAMLKTAGMNETDIDNLFTTIDSAMEIIKSNLEALDYAWEADIDDRGFLPVKPNSDKLYKVSQDFSTLCRKRILQGAIANQLQAALNRALTREEGIAIRDALMAIQAEGKQIEVACALCYVEAARMKSPAQIQKFLNDKEKVLRDYFSGQDRATMKHKIEQAELDVRRQIREELGDITAKDGTQINILDPKDSPLKKLPTKIAQRIRDAKREARSSYTVTEEQQKIIDEAKKMTAYDFTDPVGLENLAKNHREIFDAYTSFVRNATKSKGIENDTWWRAGDSNTISDLLIRQMNDENGLRTQSWSDFQVKHLMDYIAATIELSSRGAKQHAYTKVIDYVDLMGDTGVMINMSLIPTREYNGKLEYDNVEGFVAKEARRLREKYHKTAGTICIGIDNDQIRQLLADDFIDYVIPYHNSGMAAHTRAAMHIPTWENYQDFQGEKKLSRSAAEENAKRFGVKLLEESDPMYHESPNFSDWYSLDRARQLAKNAGKTGKYGVMTGGYAAMQDAARNYMQICAERGLAPKFSYGRADFSGEENYWKLLIDRKMVDNVTGDIIEQEKIQPRFDFNTIERILNDELDRYGKVKADQNEATRRVTEAFLSGKLKAGMSAEAIAEIMQKPVDNISITNITQNNEQFQTAALPMTAQEVQTAEAEDNAPAVAESMNQYQMADDAKERFGTTTDFAEAGYVLRDGSMLRFTNDKHAGTRDYDHRAIGLIYGANIDLTKNHGFNAEAGKYLEQFVEDGNIRFEAGEPDLNMDAGIQLSSSIPLTREQEQTIRDFIDWKEQREASYKPDEYSLYTGTLALHIDFGGDADNAAFAAKNDKNGLSYYGNVNPDRVIQDIRNYYRTGEIRQSSVSQFHDQYQLADTAADEIHKAVTDKNYSGDIKLTEKSPSIILGHKGVRDLPMLMKASHIRENILTEAEAKALGMKVDGRTNYHGLGEDLFKDVINDLDEVKEAYRGTRNADNTNRRENYFLLISTHKDADGNTINVPVYINERRDYNRVFIDTNLIATAYGKHGLRDYLNREIRNGNLVRIKNKSAISSEHQAPIAFNYADNASEDIKSSSDDSVNTQEQYQASEAWDDGELFNNRALVSEETIDKWLTGGWFGSNTNENYAQAYIAYLTPSQYLRMTTIYDEGRVRRESDDRTMSWVKDVSEGQPIQLKIDAAEGKVYDHEGRHRMVVLDRNGVKHIPVLLFDMDTKYSKEPLAELKLEGQNFNGMRNYATTTVRDLVPLNRAHRDEIIEKFSKKTSFEKVSEKLDGYNTLQFQMADQEYMDAVNSGNTEEQQRMVDEAARATGYTIRAYHGSPHTDISVFDINRAGENTGVYGDRAIWFTDSERFADDMSYQQLEGSSAFRSRRGSKGKVYDTYLRINNPFDIQNMTPAMRDLLWEMNLSKLRSMGMYPENSSMGNREYFFETVDAALEAGNDQYVKFYVDYSMLQEAGYDAIIARLFTNNKRDNSVEYGVFSPEQIKSADPVTYDQTGNIVPLSQRFNPDRQEIQYQMYDNTADDSMFEAEERQKAWNDLQAENAVLEDTVTQLRKEIEKLSKQAAQLKRTDKPEVRMNDARKMARQIIKDTRPEPITTRDKMEIRELTNRLSQQIKEIGDYILETGKNPNEIDYSEIRSMAQDIARDIVNNAEVEIDDGAGTKDMRDEMRAALRNRPIFVPEQYRSDVLDWNDFKKRYRNIFTFKDSGTDIDIVYQSLLEEIPGLLDPNINNPGDMLNELADKWDVLQPKYENPFDDFTNEAINHYTNMILQGALDGTLRQIAPTYADRMNNRISEIRAESRERVAATRAEGRQALEDLRAEKNARIEEIRQQGIARKQEALAKERADKWERVAATREYYQEMAQRASTRRKNSETRTKIKGLINDMNSRLLHGTEKKYVPAHLVENTVRILEMIDLDTGRENVKLQERLALLQQQYAALKNDQTFAGYSYDPILEDLITDMARTVGDTPLRNMNNTQLEKVYQTLRELEHTIRTAVKDKIYGEEINFYESARAATKATNAISGSSANALGKASNWYLTNTMRPDVVFERFGGFAKDSEWTKIADMLNRAQRYGMDLQLKFSQPFEELLKDKKKLAKLTSTKAEDMVDIGLKDENGESIKITRDFMLFTYMNLFNEDNIQHVMRGGITVPALKEYLAGRGDRGYGIGSRHAVGISQRLSDINHAIEDSTDANEKAALLQEKEDVLKEGMEYINNLRENIEKNLTEYDQKWIDAWWKFNKMATDVLNETTMNTYGIKKFLVERYFPIITDRNYLNVPMETIIKDMSLENAGFTKERIHASNPIKMMGLADLINMQANRTAQYASIMPAVRAFNKIYNKTMPGYSTSVKSALNSKFGSEATKFIENLMADLQGGRHGDYTIFDRLRGRMAQATLSLNPRVALAQTASFPTAAAELGWKPVMKALARGGKNNALISAADRELIQKWSSALWYRSRGYNSVELGDVKNMQQAQHKVMDKLGWAMNWINFMDSATVGRLWYAAQYYVDEQNPELQKGSDAYYEKVAEAFNRCIENTQPNYTTMQRPELLRKPDAIMRQLSMFMTQRLQNQSILYGAVAKYMKYRADLASGKNGVTQADVNEMGKRAAWAASSQIAAAATITVFKFLCDALLHRLNAYRRDEDKKLTPESISLAMLNNFAESLASNMFLGSEIYAATKSAITKETYYGIELSGVTTLTDNINNAVKFVQQPSWGLAKKLGESLAQFYGIPAANAEKIGQAIWYWMEDAMKGEFMEAGVERTDAMNAKLLTEAYASGDQKAIEKYSGTFENDDDLLDSVRSYVKTGYVNKDKQTISKTEAVKLLVQAGTRQKDAEAKVQEWTCELVTGIPFSKIKDEFMAGNITQSRVIELLQKYGGRDKETAERTARSYACEKETGHPYTDLKEAYILGEVSRSVLEKAVKKYGGMNAEDTQKKLYYYDYLKENPTSDLNENRAVAYMTKLKPAGIKAKDYEDILNKADADKNGAYTQNEVGSWLENKGYSKKEAEALWSAMGPTWKTGFDAWQVKYKADLAGNKNNNVSQKELGPYLVQQINSGKMSLEEAEGYWKVFFSKSSTTFKKWLKKNRYKLG